MHSFKESSILDILSPMLGESTLSDPLFNTPSSNHLASGHPSNCFISKVVLEVVHLHYKAWELSLLPVRHSCQRVTSPREMLLFKCSKDNRCYRINFFSNNNCKLELGHHLVFRS